MLQPLFISETDTAWIIFSVILLYYLYYYSAHFSGISRLFRHVKGERQKERTIFLFTKLSGFFIMGVVPGLLWYFLIESGFSRFGLTFEDLVRELKTILILILLIAAFTYIHQKIRNEHNSLQMNVTEWDLPLFITNCIGWVLYLAGYEFLFRGVLLTVCYHGFGFWPAIAINAGFYSATHMVYGKSQAIGALTFGTLACYLALKQGTLFIPFFMHTALSLFTDFFSLKMNRKLSYVNLSTP